ncbi:hypothetical protein FRC09_012645 [Ceratobasidium sp. 395]|nr:hypothetical protein FRC09_012645 [Ceratobasidium sp. 395]
MSKTRIQAWTVGGPVVDAQALIPSHTTYDRRLIEEYLHDFARGSQYPDRPAVPADDVPASVARLDELWEKNRERLHIDLIWVLWEAHITPGTLSLMERLRVRQFEYEARELRDGSSTPSSQDDEDAWPHSELRPIYFSNWEHQDVVVAEAWPETSSEALPAAGPEVEDDDVVFLGTDWPIAGSSDRRAWSDDARPFKRQRIEKPRTAN